jgi:UDP-N-acetylglucosamine transferase subunit ALG13
VSLVLVLVGTDHHPFDRVITWADALAQRHPEADVLVQHGHSPSPRVARGRDFLGHDEMLDLLDRAESVVCHGGPGTIMDARSVGHVPVCVPRDPTLGEHVDAHQQRFAALVARAGIVSLAQSWDELCLAVDGQLRPGGSRRSHAAPASPATDLARVRVAHELDALLRVPRQRRALHPSRIRAHHV